VTRPKTEFDNAQIFHESEVIVDLFKLGRVTLVERMPAKELG
jgi:hypothetical protein